MESMSEKSACSRCGNRAELDQIDFGPYINQWVCNECWDAENERAWAGAK